MQNNIITDTHTKGETPDIVVELTSSDLMSNKWDFLREWANKLGVSIEVLSKRILIAAVEGSHYAEKMPEI